MASIEEILKNKGISKPRVSLRNDGRKPDQLRDIRITRGYLKYAPGSCLIEVGDTKVICAANVEDHVPPHLRNTGSGWITAEYGMLPGSTSPRSTRDASRGRVGGRTHEIQRLIGRSLRAAVQLNLLGERTIWLDCDVLQADGGTRTASITGAYVALRDAITWMLRHRIIATDPVKSQIAAVSVGIVDENLLLDLNYEEDSQADVDMNVVMTGEGRIIEIQGTAEGDPFSQDQMEGLMGLAKKGIEVLIEKQREALSD
ncbi:MAG: ribonuclease PH [Deltaproteobacteria bacterium]|nr:MAG: ribonuclease PH [Deltaproteobacteria bacterium]